MYGRKGILAVLILWHLGLSYAQDINSCIDGFTGTGFSINDVETNKDIFSFPIKASQINIDSFTIASDTEAERAELSTYFSLVLDDNALVLKSTDNLLNIDRFIQEPQTRTYYLVTGSIALTCDGASISQTIYISIYDTNNNAPIFNDDSPEFSVPMPIMPGVDISKYFSIEASDLDFTLINSNIIFTTDHDSDFETTSTNVGFKTFSPSLTARRTVHYTGNEVITLTATDTGNPSNSKTVQITITANEDDSLDVPSFTRSYYTYQYTIRDDDSPVLTPVGEEIAIVTNKPDSVIIGEIEGDYNDLFKITTLGDKLSLSLTDKLPSDAPPSFTITVKFETDYSAYTAVIIDVPHSLTFDKPYYSGTYSKTDNSLDIEDFTITTALKPDTPLPVTVEAAYDNYFKVTCRADNKCSLSILNPPSDIPDLDESQIVFTITAQQGDLTDTSVVVIEVPQTTYTLTFDKPYYSGTYSKIDDNLEIEDFTLTTTLEDETPLSVIVEADYAGYFAVSCNNDNKCKLSITNPPLDVPDLEGSQVLFTITAQQGDLTDTSVVAIEVSQTTYSLTFDKPYYSGTYSKIDDNLEIEDFTLTTTLEDETPLSVIVEADYAGYFAVSCSNDNKCKLSITNPPLDIPDLVGSQVVFTITAQQGDLTDTSVVAIEVSQTTYSLTFDKPYYSGTYSKIDDNLEIEDFTLTTTLEDETPLSVVVEADYAGYFAVSCSEDNKCKLSITNPPLDIPALLGSQVVFIITAQQGDLTDTSVVAIEVEEETDVPKFSHSLYSFSYSGDSLELTPTDGHDIEITSNKLIDASQLSLDAGPDFNSYFNVPELLNGNKVSISLLTSLPLDSPHVLNVTLSCETDIKTETALVITLPVDTLSFDSTFYYGTYDKDTKTLSIDPFTVVTTLQGPVTVTPEDDYQDKFKVNCDESHQCVLSLIELDVTDIESHEIVFNIEAVVGDQKDNSVVVIDIQSNEDLDVPKFSSSLYSFNYSVDNNGNGDLVPTDNLVITVQSKKLNEIEITLDAGEYRSYFNDPQITNNEITITLKDTFPENVPSLLTATLSCETDYSTETVILISIPHENAALKFDKLFYSGTYDRDESSLTIIDPIAVITELDGELSVTPDNEYADMFNIDCEQESHVCTLSVQNLDVSDLDNHEIVFTITGRIDDVEASSVVVIDIQSNEDLDVPKFSSSLYSFNYSVDNNGNADLVPTDNLVITVESKKLNEIEITLDAGEYSSLFNDPRINNNEITISLKDTFPENAPSLLTAILSCETDYKVATAIIISIPHENAVLKFDKLFYSGTYDRDESSLTIIDPIAVITELEGELSVTPDNEYADMFNIDCEQESHVCTLSVQNLDVSDLDNHEIVFTITGRIDDIEDSSVVVIDIQSNEDLDVPKFSSSLYSFNYSVDNNGNGDLVPTDNLVITVQSKKLNEIEITLDAGEYSSLFNDPRINNNEITISLKDTFPENAPSLLTAILSCETDYKVATAIIISIPHENAGLKFDKLFYSGTYDRDEASLTIIDPIAVITELNGELSVTPDDEYADMFNIQCEQESHVCTLSVQNLDVSDIDNHEIVFTITGRIDDIKDSSVVVIDIQSNEDLDVPKFSSSLYSFNYSVDNNGNEDLVPTDNLVITVESKKLNEIEIILDAGEYTSFFNVPGINNNEITISLKDTFPENTPSLLTATLSCKTDYIVATAIVISIPHENAVLKFDKLFYSGTYDRDEASLTIIDPIAVITELDGELSVTPDDEYTSFFNVPGINNNEITISLKDTFPENTPSLLTATLSCKTDYIVATAIVISIPHENAVLKFDKLFYSGTYDRDEDSLTVESITIITELVGHLEVTVDNEYASKFKIECDDNTHVCKLSVQNLDVSDLEKNEIVFTITGRIEDIGDTEASSVVIIDIHLDEQLDVPSFESSSYRFDYKYDGEAPELEPTDGLVITIKTDKDEDKITLILDAGDLTTYFNQPQLNDKTITITLAKELPEDAPSLVTATLSCTTDYTADTAIIISLPKENADLKFDKLFYSGTYDKDKESLITIDPITVITTLQGELVVTPDDDYSNKFTIECPANVCAISEVNLDESDLEKSELVFTITARVGSVENSAVVIIDIQPSESLDVPSFESSLYRFSYNRSDEETALVPSDDVEITIITTKIDKVTLSLDAGDYNSSFDLPQLNENTVTISLKGSGLPANTPSLLALTLVCETDYKTETAIIIEVAQGNVKFDQPFYSGTYDKDTEGFTFDTIIVNTDLTEDLTVTLDDDYRTKFGVECTGRECSLSVVSLEQSDIENSEIVFTIKANIGEHEDTSVVVINIHETLDLPTFSSSSYSFIYSIDGEENPDLTPSDGLVITIDTTKPEKVTVSLDEGDYKDYFKDPILSDNIVTLQLKEPLPENIPDDFITVTLTCETDYATSSAILIQISKDTSTLRFSKLLYSGTYIVKEEAFSVEDIEVQTILSGDLEVVPESPYNDNFKVECDQGTRICKMSITDLTGLDLRENLIFKINANIGDEKDTSLVVIKISQDVIDVPSFGSGLYRFNYSDQDEANPTLIPTDGLEITVVTDKLSEDISFTFDGDYKSIFGDPQLIGEKVKLNLIDTLPEEAPSVITINLSFETDYIAKTTLEITVPNEEKLTFDKKFYVGVYDSNSESLVSIDSIKISSDISGALSVRPDSGFEDKIEIVCDTNKNCQLTVISLEDSDLENEQLEFNIIAKIDTFETTSAVSISILKSFEFSEISYSAKYSVDSNGEGTLSDLFIDILHSENPGSLSITLAKYSEYFTFEYTTSESKYKLSKLDNIPVALLTTNTELITEITASEDDRTTKAVLKIELTELTAQKFDSNYYRAEYKINENQDLATVSLEDSVTFAVGNPADINIEFEDKYKNNFVFNFEQNTWVIKVKQNLNENDMLSYTHIVISLTSKNKDYSFLTDSAALVLSLPVTSAEDYPVFSEIFYTAEYFIEGAEHTLSDTKIEAHNEDGTKLQVTLVSDGMYSDYFTIDQDGDYYKLSVKTNLDDDIINEEISITLVVEATVGGLTAQAPVVINLPLKRANSDLAFEKVLYSGNIDKKGNLEIKDNIKITTDIDDGDVIVSLSSSDYKKYFVASYKDKKLSIAYSDTEIPEETLKKVNVIPLELTASVKGTSVQASAVINIAVEHSTDEDDDDDDDGHPTNYTGYIAAISVLTVLLVGFLVGSIVLWYLKFRPRKFMTLDEDSVSSFEAKNSRFEKNPKLSEPIPAPIETRRPTGFSFSSPLELRDDEFAQSVQYLEPIEPPEEVVVETSPYENVEKEKPKSVAFDDVVEEMQIDAKDESENEEDEEEERYINLDPKVEDQEAEPEKEDNVSRL